MKVRQPALNKSRPPWLPGPGVAGERFRSPHSRPLKGFMAQPAMDQPSTSHSTAFNPYNWTTLTMPWLMVHQMQNTVDVWPLEWHHLGPSYFCSIGSIATFVGGWNVIL